ncbi:MAG: hypothetical protein HDS65_02995 [Bacteroidales bacterium]|nr:hypothetical protein [Bacteroidales bacterium]
MEDRSTWDGNVKLDKVIDPETGETALAVSALTLYIYKPNNPMDRSLLHLKHVKDFKVYACPGAVFNPEYIPIGCDSVLVDKIDPNVPGRIRVPKGRWDTWQIITQNRWFFSKLVAHWLDANEIIYWSKDDAIVDLSNNELDVVLINYLHDKCGPNLSHNKFTADKDCWTMMFDMFKYDIPFPNLQYNDIEIPDSIIGTEFWEKYHENFIGNPGYVAP